MTFADLDDIYLSFEHEFGYRLFNEQLCFPWTNYLTGI